MFSRDSLISNADEAFVPLSYGIRVTELLMLLGWCRIALSHCSSMRYIVEGILGVA